MSAATGQRSGPVSGGWALSVLVALTQRAHDCLAKAGARQLEACPAGALEDTRFMTDASGGGSRTLEAAMRERPESRGHRR